MIKVPQIPFTDFDKYEEIWAPVFLGGQKSRFEVSNLGRVRSFYWNKYYRILKPQIDKGYFKIRLLSIGRSYTCIVSRLVALSFIPNPKNLPEVNHLFGNKLDNRASVLEWGTKADNMQHAVRTGLYVAHKFSNKEPRPVVRLLNGEEDKVYRSFHQLNKEFPTTSVLRSISSGRPYRGYNWNYK